MNRPWPYSLLMFVWLTIGYATVHVVIAYWGISVAQGLFPEQVSYDQLHVTEDGDPVIYTWNGSYDDVVLKRLDGTQITKTIGLQQTFAGATILTVPNRMETESWESRILGANDYQQPSAYWYFIAPPNRSETGYFVGYQQLTRRQIGYIGINGFMKKPPSVEQSFPVKVFDSPYNPFAGTICLAQSNYNNRGTVEPTQNNGMNYSIANVAPDTAWILSDGTVYEIKFGSMTVRKLIEDRPDMRYLSRDTVERDKKYDLQLVIRTETGVLIVDPETGKSDSLPLEPVPPNHYENLYRFRDGRMLIVHANSTSMKDRSQKNQLIWLDAQGQVERRAEIQLNSYWMETFSNADVGLTLCAPLPLVSWSAWLFGHMVGLDQSGLSGPDSGWLKEFPSQFKIWLVVSSLIGMGTGWACRRRERDVFGRTNWFWPVIVGVCGLFGWMGYICLSPLPAHLPNGNWLPLTPEPVRSLGTEILV